MSALHTSEKRNQIRRKAASIGINEAYISLLVEEFYHRIRRHEILGPIFDNAIEDDEWEHHLAQMKMFWVSVTMNAGTYKGQPVPAHKKHSAKFQDWHFGIWLGLFRQTLEDTAPTSEAIDYFMERAERIAENLKLAIFGIPELGAPTYG